MCRKEDLTLYTVSNIHKGRILEDSINTAISSLGVTLKEHYTNRQGLDLTASINNNVSIIGEAINWYGGFIHPNRFKSIIGSLSQKADIKFFFCAGVKPTKEQSQVLRAMNIKVIHLPKQVLKVNNETINILRSKILAVIYFTLSFTLSKSIGNSISSFKSKVYRILKAQQKKSMEQKGIGYISDYREVGNYISKLVLCSITSKYKVKVKTMQDKNSKDSKQPMTVKEAGRKGGLKTAATHGREFYEEIGRKGGKKLFGKYGPEFYSEIGRKGGSRVRKLIQQGKEKEESE
jgi:general stress protein YciG